MKKFLSAFSVLCAGATHAAPTLVECQVNYTSADGAASINTVETLDLSPFTYTKIPVGNLILEVGMGGIVTISTGEKFSMVSVEIFDEKFQTGQAGDVSSNPNYPAKASYQVEGSKESLTASCTLVH